MIDAGDLAAPAKCYRPPSTAEMRLEAEVGEQYGPSLHPGALLKLLFPAEKLELEATSRKIVALDLPVPARPS